MDTQTKPVRCVAFEPITRLVVRLFVILGLICALPLAKAYADNGPTATTGTNDTLENAAPIPVNYRRTSELSKGVPTRYYSINLPESGKVSLSVTSWVRNKTRITIYDSAGQEIQSEVISRGFISGDADAESTLDLRGGKYYLSFGADDGGKGKYRFILHFTPAKESYPEFADADEEESRGGARFVALGKSVKGQLAMHDGRDSYKLVVKKPVVALLRSASWVSADVLVSLEAEDGSAIWSGVMPAKGAASGAVGLDKGVYLLTVTPYDQPGGEGTLTGTGNYRINITDKLYVPQGAGIDVASLARVYGVVHRFFSEA